MLTSAPVRGLRPIPVLRGRTLKTPNPRSSMRSPWASAFFMLSKTVSTASSALVLVMPVLLTTSLMISSLITGQLSSNCQKGRNLQMLLDFLGDCQWSNLGCDCCGILRVDSYSPPPRYNTFVENKS